MGRFRVSVQIHSTPTGFAQPTLSRLTDRCGYTSHIHSKVFFLVVLNLFLLAAGCTMGIFSALVVVVPLLTPMARAFDIHPIHPGIIFFTNLEIGVSLPPLGINLFIAGIRFPRPVLNLYAASIPFILILPSALAVIAYIPWLSLALLE